MIQSLIDQFNENRHDLEQTMDQVNFVTPGQINEYLDLQLIQQAIEAKNVADVYRAEFERQRSLGMIATGFFIPYVRLRRADSATRSLRLQCEWRRIIYTSQEAKKSFTRYVKKGAGQHKYPMGQFQRASEWEKEVIAFSEENFAGIRKQAEQIGKLRRSFNAFAKINQE